MREKPIEDHLRDECKQYGGLAVKFLPYFVVGFPDRIVLLPGGKIAFVELKRPGEEPRKAQWVWLNRLRALGFEAVWFDSKEKISAWLSDFLAR